MILVLKVHYYHTSNNMKELSYEQAFKRLEEVVNLLENSQIPLEESIQLFQEGIELSKFCEEKLKTLEEQVVKIMETTEQKDK